MFNSRKADQQKSMLFGIMGVITFFMWLPSKIRSVIVVGAVAVAYGCYWIHNKYFKQSAAKNKNVDHGLAEWTSLVEFLYAGYEKSEGLWIGNGICKKQGHLITIAGLMTGTASAVTVNFTVNILEYSP